MRATSFAEWHHSNASARFSPTTHRISPVMPIAPKSVIAMIHVGALPGTPASRTSVSEIAMQAAAECRVYRDGGVHAIGIENMHDVPYLRGGVGPEITAAMTIVAHAVKDAAGDLPVGIQILAGANHEALAVAHAASLDFVRVEGFAFAHVADEGFIDSSAASLLRYRRALGAQRVQVWADVKKKHSSHAITADIADVRQQCRLPLILGSGITAENLAHYYPQADGFIVGSFFKMDGRWSETVDPRRVERFMTAHAVARGA